jgi:hypothetical protein
MTQPGATTREPLWLQIEDKLRGVVPQQLADTNRETTIQQLARELDERGFNVSRHAGHMLQLRGAVAAAAEVGRPLLKDLDEAVGALTLEDVADPVAATAKIVGEVGATWPQLRLAERRPDVRRIVERTRLDLQVARAREMEGDAGVRYLITEGVKPERIVARLEITEADYERVKAEVEAELAERRRVEKMLDEVSEQPEEARIKKLIDNDVARQLIVELAGVSPEAVEAVEKAMEEELKEKQRKAEEEAARKAAEAAGPSLEDIPDDELLEYIESIREIMEFSDKEDEIRTMCEQSSIPKSVVDVAVSGPDKLDELEKKAGG